MLTADRSGHRAWLRRSHRRAGLRLDGFYYALLTLGLNELFRVFFTTSKQFGSASGGLYGADSFINQTWPPTDPVDGRLLRLALPA